MRTRLLSTARSLGGVLAKVPPAAPMIAVAAIVALAVSATAAPTRALVLAGAGGAIVAVTETLYWVTVQRTWPGQPVEAGRRLGRGARTAVSITLGVVVSAVAWTIVVAASTIATETWLVVAAGGLGAIIAPTLLVVAWQRRDEDS